MTRTPTEVRQIVERVANEHGHWRLSPWACGPAPLSGLVLVPPGSAAGCSGSTKIRFYMQRGTVVRPEIEASASDEICAAVVALWPEMQRLVAMLREALR
jgi:hypothetical protein